MVLTGLVLLIPICVLVTLKGDLKVAEMILLLSSNLSYF